MTESKALPVHFVLCDSLEKVLPLGQPRPFDQSTPLVAFAGQSASFQVAVMGEGEAHSAGRDHVRLRVSTQSNITARISTVELVPVEYPAPPTPDDGYFATEPGLYPDLLLPAPDGELTLMIGQWRAWWIDLDVSAEATTSQLDVTVEVFLGESSVAKYVVPMHVVGEALPELDIPNSHWFHCDGLANYYGYEVFGEQHWGVIERFMGAARQISANAILTPVWTPPLDTGEGHYRTPTQLLGITEVTSDDYEFDFTLLLRWIKLCKDQGFRYLEIAHLFTQWGAKATPAIYVQTADGLQRRFGWDVAATDPRYRAFLKQMLPALLEVLDSQWGIENVLFHISDEPTPETVDGYALARATVVDLLAGCRIVDAISDLSLYETGIVPEPIVATDHATAFLDRGIRPWLYYCVAQDTAVANRFIAQPSVKNRAIGAQLFSTRAAGFLHWGFNFYNAARSVRSIDPFLDTCADRSFLGGDAFLVYPGPDGQPLESIRFHVFAEAINDLRNMHLVRDRLGFDRVIQIIDPQADLTLKSFPTDPNHYRKVLLQLALASQEMSAQ